MYDQNGKLSRAAAVRIIASGGTVLHKGRVYGSAESLPSEADFAKGDPSQEAAARERLQKQIADAQSQLAKLDTSAVPATAQVGDGYEAMNIGQLRDIAKGKGIDGAATMHKADLIAALRQ